MKKKIIIIISIVVVLIAGAIAGIFFLMPMTSTVMGSAAVVSSVAEITGSELAFSSNRYSGVVEMKDLVSVKADADKIIKKTYVKEGDTVKKGDKLFEYDIDQLKLQRSQYQLDLDQAQAEITLSNSQISSFEKEKNNADQNERLRLENEILGLKLKIKKAEYTVSQSTKEIEKLDKAIKNNVIKSETDGKIQKIQSLNSISEEDVFADSAYIKIATNDNYKVKTMISEANIDTFSKDTPVIVRSRVDETKIWKGKVTSIDTTAPSTSESMMGGVSDTKYPVYIELENTDGLMIGQHIAVELDMQESTATKKLKLKEFYICDINTAPYVWCMNESNVLEKRTVKLGEYNKDSYTYEILSGLTAEDYIAFPVESYVEGMSAIVSEMPDEMPEVDPMEVQ